MRVNLKVFRIKNHLSQTEMGEKIGCTRATYASIENGSRAGRQEFWKAMQAAFDLPDSEMWLLMKDE